MTTLSAFAAGAAGNQDLRVDAMGNLDLARGLESVRQRVIERVRFFAGEWFLDAAAGVPYYQRILTRPADTVLAAVAITDQIRDVDGVVDVRDVRAVIDPATRRLTWSATVDTDAGAAAVNGDI